MPSRTVKILEQAFGVRKIGKSGPKCAEISAEPGRRICMQRDLLLCFLQKVAIERRVGDNEFASHAAQCDRSENGASGCLTIVIAENSAEALATLDFACAAPDLLARFGHAFAAVDGSHHRRG
jgi:hypothetical protein